MNEADDTEQCPNCKLDILSTNYTTHYVHCQRNFYLCCKCEKPVNYGKRVEHDKTNHVTVHCTSCQLALEKCFLDNHLINDCPNRKVKCQICDIDVEAVDIAEHEDYCGSRTEKCLECNEFVMLKYKALHLESNHTFIKLSDEPGPSPSWQNGRRTLYNFMPDLTSGNYKPASFGKRKSSENLRKARNSGGSSKSKNESETVGKVESFSDQGEELKAVGHVAASMRKSSPRKVSDLGEWPALASLRSLQISDEKEENQVGAKANSSQNEEDEDSDLMYAIKVSQEINSEIWNKEMSSENEILKNCFKPLPENESTAAKSIKKNMFEKKMEDNKEPKFGMQKKDFNYFYDKHESVKLPCEFCGNLIVSNNLALHQSRCRFYNTADNYSVRSAKHKMPYFDEDVEKKIACGVCNKFFKLSLLENHQVCICNYGLYVCLCAMDCRVLKIKCELEKKIFLDTTKHHTIQKRAWTKLHCQRNPIKSQKNQNFSKNFKALNMESEPGLQNGLEPSSPQLRRVGTRSEWLSELTKSSEGEQDLRNNLNHPQQGNISRTIKVSRKSRRAPSPPTR